jgi:hypothetical protein
MDQPFKPSLREAARRGAAAKRQTMPGATPPGAPGKPPPAVAMPPKSGKPKPPAVATEQVAAACGHAVPFELYADTKDDKFRDVRRKKLTERDCPECRAKAHAERTAAEQAAARERRAARPEGKPGPRELKGRLPDGATFNVTWDAAAGRWSGTLTVPGVGAFTDSRPGLFKLNRALDDQYRATLPAEAAPEAAAG